MLTLHQAQRWPGALAADMPYSLFPSVCMLKWYLTFRVLPLSLFCWLVQRQGYKTGSVSGTVHPDEHLNKPGPVPFPRTQECWDKKCFTPYRSNVFGGLADSMRSFASTEDFWSEDWFPNTEELDTGSSSGCLSNITLWTGLLPNSTTIFLYSSLLLCVGLHITTGQLLCHMLYWA